MPKRLARYPSTASLMPAARNRRNAASIQPVMIAHTMTGTERMRASVMRLGMLKRRPRHSSHGNRPAKPHCQARHVARIIGGCRGRRVGGSTRMNNRTDRKRVAILVSRRGSNMTALVEAAKGSDYPAQIALVFSNRPDAAGLARAQAEQIPTAVVDHRHYKDRAAFERALQAELEAHRNELVCLAGFMRLLSPWLVERWEGRMLNIHPALLPAFKGLDTHRRALEAGGKTHRPGGQ